MKPFFTAMEIFREYTNNTKFIFAFFTSLILLFSGLLCYDYRASALQDENEILGYITYKTKVIKRRPDSTVVWYDAEDKQPLTRGDTIRSEELSNAVITLNDGTELRVEENSMVILDFSEKNIKLDFQYGSVQINRKANSDSILETISGNTKVDLKDGDMYLNKRENESLKLIANRGQAIVKQGKEETNLKENYTLEANGNEKPIVKELELVLLTPNPMKVFNAMGSSEKIYFKWKTKEKKSKLEIGMDSSFKNIIYTKEVDEHSHNTNLSVGSYYWRVVSKNEISEHRKFSILQETPFLIRLPKDKEEYKYIGKDLFINFNWNALPGIKMYSLEIAEDANFKNIFLKQELKIHSISLNFAKEGIFFCRVKAEFNHPDFIPRYSDIHSFKITKSTSLSPPQLISPKNTAVIDHRDRILLNWKANGFDSYFLKLSSDSEFKSLVLEKNLADNYILLPELENKKTYYWIVEGISNTIPGKNLSVVANFSIQMNENLQTDNASKTRSLENAELAESEELEYTAPVLLAPKSEFIAEEGKVERLRFSWKGKEGEFSYQFFVYKKLGGKDELVHREITKKNFLEIKEEKLLTKGEFNWYVELQLKDKEGKLLSKKSAKRTYTILPALLPPKIKKSPDVYYLDE